MISPHSVINKCFYLPALCSSVLIHLLISPKRGTVSCSHLSCYLNTYSSRFPAWSSRPGFQQILSSMTFSFTTGRITRTLGPSNDFTLLNGCTGKCVRLIRLLAFECTLNHCIFIHSFIHSLKHCKKQD